MKRVQTFMEFIEEAIRDERGTLQAVRNMAAHAGADRHVLDLISEAMDKLDAAAYWLRKGTHDHAEEDREEGSTEDREEAVAEVQHEDL